MAEQRFKFTNKNGDLETEWVETAYLEIPIHAENIRSHQSHPDHLDVWIENEPNSEIWDIIPPLAFPEDN